MKRIEVIISLEIEGTHCWPECPFEDVAFLRDAHRHIFTICATKEVTHDDRDVEIILLKRKVESWIQAKYGKPASFGTMSCEQIGKALLEHFDLSSCEVLEDNENGAKITAL